MRKLRSYQKRALRKFRHKDGAFFAMEMRLGKTLTCIRWLRRKKARRVLVLAPMTVLISWMDELDEEGIRYINLTNFCVSDRETLLDLFQDKNRYFLLNYETYHLLVKQIRRVGFDALVLDESTKVKNAKAKVTKALVRSCEEFPVRAALSGLPSPQSWGDLWTQMAIINGAVWMGHTNFWSWRKRYAKAYGYDFFWKTSEIKASFHEDAYVLTRKQAGLGEKKIYEKRVGQLTVKARALYDHILKTWEIPGEEETDAGSSKYAMVVATWLRRLCGGFLPTGSHGSWKYRELKELLDGELRNEQVVVWFAFNAEIIEAYRTYPASTVLTGRTPRADRRRIFHKFQSGRTRVLFIQQRLGRFGVRLDAASTAIYFSNSYDYEDRAQSEDRIVRVGKDEPLLYIDFITQDTIEEDLIDAIKDKKAEARWLLTKVKELRCLAQR